MDKYKQKKTIKKWFSYINLNSLSGEAKVAIQKFNAYRKKLTFDCALKLFLFAINDETESLRHLDRQLINPNMKKTFGLDSISYSQLSRALKDIDQTILMEIFIQLLEMVKLKTMRTSKKKLYLIDSTTFSFGKKNCPWAIFRPTKAGVKLHLSLCFMEDGLVHPEQFKITNAHENDNKHLEVFINKKEAIYVFDRGYYEFKRFNQLVIEDYKFVTRLKSNTIINVKEDYTNPKNPDSLRDQLVTIGSKDESEKFRMITIPVKGKSDLVLITNLMDTEGYKATDIGNIYKSRWQIELFFKHIKQHMTITTYFSKSEVGVHNQIILAMIAYLLTLLLKIEINTKKTIFQILRIFRELKFESIGYFLTFFDPG